MSGRSELAALQWLWGFCSPYLASPALPADDAWQDIFKVADRHLVLPRLAIALLPRRDELREEVADYLESVLALCRYRSDRLRSQLLTFCRSLNEAGIEPILLKGAPFLLSSGTSRYQRMMVDLDVWVPDSAEREQAIRCLHDLGYAMLEDPATSTHTQHYPPFGNEEELARVELHWAMVNARYADMLDQPAIAAASVRQLSDDIRYRLLDDRAALALSYLQCRHGVGTNKGYVSMMKWLDFLDRAHRIELGPARLRADLGLSGKIEEQDRLILTAFSRWGGLPYDGERDDRFCRFWESSYRQPFIVGYAKAIFGPAFQMQRWRGKTPAGLIRAIGGRLKKLPLHHERARSRDRFGS